MYAVKRGTSLKTWLKIIFYVLNPDGKTHSYFHKKSLLSIASLLNHFH
jgi:hypothetical protein